MRLKNLSHVKFLEDLVVDQGGWLYIVVAELVGNKPFSGCDHAVRPHMVKATPASFFVSPPKTKHGVPYASNNQHLLEKVNLLLDIDISQKPQ